jgi:hypothetical protein
LLWRSVVRSVAKLTGKLFDYRILSNDWFLFLHVPFILSFSYGLSCTSVLVFTVVLPSLRHRNNSMCRSPTPTANHLGRQGWLAEHGAACLRLLGPSIDWRVERRDHCLADRQRGQIFASTAERYLQQIHSTTRFDGPSRGRNGLAIWHSPRRWSTKSCCYWSVVSQSALLWSFWGQLSSLFFLSLLSCQLCHTVLFSLMAISTHGCRILKTRVMTIVINLHLGCIF